MKPLEDNVAMSKIMGAAVQAEAGEAINKVSIRKREGKTERQTKETGAKGGWPSYSASSTCGRRAHKAGVKCWGTTSKCNKCGQVGHWSVVCTSVKSVEDESVKDCDSLFVCCFTS